MFKRLVSPLLCIVMLFSCLPAGALPALADAYADGITTGIVAGGSSLISDDSAKGIFDLAADTVIGKK